MDNDLNHKIGRLSAETNHVGVEFLLEQLEEEEARILCLCAIPHQFNPDLLKTLAPDLDATRREALCEELARLPLVAMVDDWLSLDDDARCYLFAKWLEPERIDEFVEVNGRLVEYYEGACESDSEEWPGAERMFHLIGFSQDEGLAQFERLFRMRRDEFRLSECDYLVGSVHEYDPLLTPLNRMRLAYHEGKLAADRNQWEESANLFHQVLDGEAANPELRARAWNRLGLVYAITRDWKAAIDSYRHAMGQLDSQGLLERDYRVIHNLGVAYRDSRYDLEQARKLLQLSIEHAEEAQDRPWAAKAYNSLGTVYLTLNDSEQAIKAYEASIRLLKAEVDRVGVAQVHNNIGLIYVEQEDWRAAQLQFRQSLETAQQAGDTLTRAHAQANLGSVYLNLDEPELAERNLKEAYSRFEEMRRPYFQAVTVRRLARLYSHIGRADLSARSYSSAIALFQKSQGKAEAQATVEEATLILHAEQSTSPRPA